MTSYKSIAITLTRKQDDIEIRMVTIHMLMLMLIPKLSFIPIMSSIYLLAVLLDIAPWQDIIDRTFIIIHHLQKNNVL